MDTQQNLTRLSNNYNQYFKLWGKKRQKQKDHPQTHSIKLVLITLVPKIGKGVKSSRTQAISYFRYRKDFLNKTLCLGISVNNLQVGMQETKILLYSYGNNRPNEEETHTTGENNCQPYILQNTNTHNIQRTQKQSRKQVTQCKRWTQDLNLVLNRINKNG